VGAHGADELMPSIDELRHYVLNTFLFTDDPSALADDASLIKQGVIDSTGILELIAHLEEAYGITVEDEEMIPDNFDSLRRISAFVHRKRAA
jgi:acyl carrier protein